MTAEELVAAARARPSESAILVPVEVPVAVRRLRDRMDPFAVLGVPAHVTLLYPFVAPEQLDESVRTVVAGIVAGEPSFPFTLTVARRWPDVVYLAPEPDEPFRRLTLALVDAFPEYPPYGRADGEVVPHVTVAQAVPESYLLAAQHALPPLLPIRDVAREAWLMVKSAGRWRTHWHLPLSGGRGG
jgi:2'-5' RNA ligase